jgi:hypothetical protein
MALGDGRAKGEAQEINKELGFILDAVSSLGDQLVNSFQDAVDGASKLGSEIDVVGKTMQRGLVADLKQSVKNTESLIDLQSKVSRGVATQRDIAKEQEKIALNRARLDAKRDILGNQLTRKQKRILAQEEEQLDLQEESFEKIKKQNTAQIAQRGILGNILKSSKGLLTTLDKSGLLAKILNNEFSLFEKATLSGEASLLALFKGILQGSDSIANIAKSTGVSADEALRLQKSFAALEDSSEKVFITSKGLNQAFTELSSQTGLIADFGGEILQTQATLTKQLGFSAEQAGKLSLLSRLQGKSTEDILSKTVKTVGAISSQNKVGLNVKKVLEDISNVSDAIAVSLGSNPTALAEAASKARLFGANLDEVDAIAGSLLDFESSIQAELEAQLLTGQNLNLSRARGLALENDLTGLSEELASNSAVISSFSSQNRIQQEAVASALGMSREQLAGIALQQEFNNLSAQQFRDTYGDITYEQLQSQSASEKFASVLEKIQGIIGDFGTSFAPFLDGLASAAGFLASNKAAATALVGVLTTLATLSIAASIAKIFGSFALLPFGSGIPLAVGAVAGLLAMISTAKTTIADDMVMPAGYGNTMITGPKGSIALNNQDSVVAGTNLFGSSGGSSGGGNSEIKETNRLLRAYLEKGTRVNVVNTDFNNQMSSTSYAIQ